MWKILLGISIFLSIVLLVCGLMLFPNSPYIKALCQAGSIPKHTLEFTYYPDKSDVRVDSVRPGEKEKQTNQI